MNSNKKPLKIAITGASGFVGKRLISKLRKYDEYNLRCLSRRDKSHLNTDKVEWFQCDLYSMLDIENALEGQDIAIYLVHSMLPSAHLTQGSFEDMDLILADNFSRACKKKGIKQVIYISGIIPEDVDLSTHLRSRLEVEKTLGLYGNILTTLRAGIVLGKEGSSFTLMKRLVQRLPILVCPSWTETISKPIYIDDLLEILRLCAGEEKAFNKIYEVGGASAISYKEMMEICAKKLGLKRRFFNLPLISQNLSKFWVCLVSGAPTSLVYPLVTSLKFHMIPQPKYKFDIEEIKLKTYEESLELILKDDSKEEISPHAFEFTGTDKKEVRSVQRLTTLLRSNASKVSLAYFDWLPKFFKPFIKVVEEQRGWCFYISFIPTPILIMKYSAERSTPDRQLYYIVGGLLAFPEGRGRIEFRDVLENKYTIAAIHEFKPKLPWYVYKYTQAIVHLWVMKSFDKYLLKKRL